MFGNTVKIKIDRGLHDRMRKLADVAGYATTEEFIEHVLEKELLRFEEAGNDDAAIREKLKGLGYIS